MSKKPGIIGQIFGVALATVVTTVGGAFVTGGDGSLTKGLLFGAVASAAAGFIFRKVLMIVVVLGVAFGAYMYIAPHVHSLLH